MKRWYLSVLIVCSLLCIPAAAAPPSHSCLKKAAPPATTACEEATDACCRTRRHRPVQRLLKHLKLRHTKCRIDC